MADERAQVPWYYALFHWFDTDRSYLDEAESPDRIDWVRVLPFVLAQLACLGVFWVGWSPVAVAVAVAAYAVRMFAITGFYHRYFSHRSFRTSRVAQFVFALLGNAAMQRGPLWWAAHHRNHHQYADEKGDPHSPRRYGFWWSHLLWITSHRNFSTDLGRVRDLAAFFELRFLNRFDALVPVLLAISMYLLGAWLESAAPHLGTSGPQMLVWGFFISTFLLFHATSTINSLAHQFGNRRFATPDDSRNNLWLALITFGEGWHNNHHYYPGAARQGFYWWEVDLSYYLLRLMSWLGLIWGLNTVPERVYAQARQPAIAGE